MARAWNAGREYRWKREEPAYAGILPLPSSFRTGMRGNWKLLPEQRIRIDPEAKHTRIAVFRKDTDEYVFAMLMHHKGEGIVR